MKKIIFLFLVGFSAISCSSDSGNSTDPPATEKTIYVNSNIESGQGELKIFVNGSGGSRSTATVKVGDVVRVESGSTAPPSNAYYITVHLDAKLIIDHYTSAVGEQMIWTHTITEQDFE